MGLLDWFKKQAKKDDIDVQEAHNQTSVYATLSNKTVKNISHEEVQAMQAEILTFLHNEDNNAAINCTCRFLTNGQYLACIQSFEKIMETVPSEKGLCENQIGAAYFFLEKYQEAVKHYLLALEHNFDQEMLDYNVWEAAEEYFKVLGDNSLAKIYLEYFPNGDSKDAAIQLL